MFSVTGLDAFTQKSGRTATISGFNGFTIDGTQFYKTCQQQNIHPQRDVISPFFLCKKGVKL